MMETSATAARRVILLWITTLSLLDIWMTSHTTVEGISAHSHISRNTKEATKGDATSEELDPPVRMSEVNSPDGWGGFNHGKIFPKLWDKTRMSPLSLYSPCKELSDHHRGRTKQEIALARLARRSRKVSLFGTPEPPPPPQTAEPHTAGTWCKLQETLSPDGLASGCNVSARNEAPSAPYSLLRDCPLVHTVECGFSSHADEDDQLLREEPQRRRSCQQSEEPSSNTTTNATTADNRKQLRVEKLPSSVGQEGNGSNGKKNKKRKGRALVLYMMHEWGRDHSIPEWENFQYFWEQGVSLDPPSSPSSIKKNSESVLFDSVDYYFYRINSKIDEVQACGSYGNVHFLWVPPGPCDLCAHARVLSFLGFDEALGDLSESDPEEFIQYWDYKSVVMLNSGVRGPFVNSLGSKWIDIVSIGRLDPENVHGQSSTSSNTNKDGTPRREGDKNEKCSSSPLTPPRFVLGRNQFYDAHDLRLFKTVFAVSLNIMTAEKVRKEIRPGVIAELHRPHAQSYFLAVPVSLLSKYQQTFIAACHLVKGRGPTRATRAGSPEKRNCISNGELKTLILAKTNGGLVYFSSLRRSLGDSPITIEAIQNLNIRENLPVTVWNSNNMYNDPCKGVFVKFGGNVMDRNKIKMKTLESVSRLSTWKRLGAAAASSLTPTLATTNNNNNGNDGGSSSSDHHHHNHVGFGKIMRNIAQQQTEMLNNSSFVKEANRTSRDSCKWLHQP